MCALLVSGIQMPQENSAQLQGGASQRRDTRSVRNGLVQDLTGRDPQRRNGPEGCGEIVQGGHFSRCHRVRGNSVSKALVPLQHS
jgi:hypothetical protein